MIVAASVNQSSPAKKLNQRQRKLLPASISSDNHHHQAQSQKPP
jgi:hypothetical protein